MSERNSREALPPPDTPDAVIEAYKAHVDRSLLRENLKLSVEERIRKLEEFLKLLQEVRQAGRSPGAGQP